MRYGPRTLKAMAAVHGRQKVFVIGRNKSGTSTATDYLVSRGFAGTSEAAGDRLLHSWAARDFRPIIDLCRTAQVLKDLPFSYPFTFQAMDQAFPGSKFVLTVWPTADDWYDAFTGFHSRQFGSGRLPTTTELKQVPYRYPGFLYESIQLLYGTPDEAPYDRATLISHYNRHIEIIQDYFIHRPDSLLVLDVGEAGAKAALCRFIGIDADGEDFEVGDPHVDAKPPVPSD